MNTIKKLSELAAYLKQVVATYSQHDYGQLHQVLRARYEQNGCGSVHGSSSWMERCGGQCGLHDVPLSQLVVQQKSRRECCTAERSGLMILLRITTNVDDKVLTTEAATENHEGCRACLWFDQAEYYVNEHYCFIFLFHAKHRTEDSFCRCMNMTGSVAADIYMLVPHKDHEATPQSVFLHELSHCVNIALTGSPEVPPEYFTLVIKLIGVDKVECDIPEFFAHCFAMSLLIEPELLSADPFKAVPKNHKQLFRTYFQLKIQNF